VCNKLVILKINYDNDLVIVVVLCGGGGGGGGDDRW
jgi:hypothetical protein